MKSLLLLILLASIALPSSVNAESYWLFVSQTGGGFAKVEIDDIKFCEIKSDKIKKSATKVHPKVLF